MNAAAVICNFLLVMFALVGGILVNIAMHFGAGIPIALIFDVAVAGGVFAGLYFFNIAIGMPWWVAPGALAIVSSLIWLI